MGAAVYFDGDGVQHMTAECLCRLLLLLFPAARYWLRFMLFGCIELPIYALRRGRTSEAAVAATSMATGWLLTAMLWHRCPVATFYTLLLPFLVSSLALMFGNWWVQWCCSSLNFRQQQQQGLSVWRQLHLPAHQQMLPVRHQGQQ